MKERRFFATYLSLAIALLLISSNVNSLGISPGRIIIDFEPNLQKTLTYDVLNNGAKTIQVEMYVKGDLAQYITLEQNNTTIESGGRKTFTYTINLPDRIETPGIHDNRIGALESMQSVNSGGAQIGARVGVESQVWIKVPYEGKYAAVSFARPETYSVKVGEPVNFEVNVENLGTEDFTASGKIDMFSVADNSKVATVSTTNQFISTKLSGTVTATWDTKNVQPGPYKAVATIFFGELNQTAEANFNVGGLTVKIIDIVHGTVKKDTITKFVIKVDSLWNEDLPNVFTEIGVYDKTGQQVSNSKSDVVTVPANGHAEMNAYWDTTGLAAGSYSAKAVLHYANKTDESTFIVDITEVSFTLWIILIAAGIAVAVTVIIIIKYKTKSRHKRK